MNSLVNPEKRADIAYKLLVYLMVKEDVIPSVDTINREIGNVADAIGVDKNDLHKFYREIMPKLLAKKYRVPGMTIDWGFGDPTSNK